LLLVIFSIYVEAMFLIDLRQENLGKNHLFKLFPQPKLEGWVS
jgi:hypothetical protein